MNLPRRLTNRQNPPARVGRGSPLGNAPLQPSELSILLTDPFSGLRQSARALLAEGWKSDLALMSSVPSGESVAPTVEFTVNDLAPVTYTAWPDR